MGVLYIVKIHWSEIAEADLDDIYDHIARDVPYYAELFVDTLIEATDRLEDHPRLGRMAPEAGHREDVRELIVQRYRLIYRLQTEQLQILTVIHGSRNLAGEEVKPWMSAKQQAPRQRGLNGRVGIYHLPFFTRRTNMCSNAFIKLLHVIQSL